ncbi:hypothetical protein QBC32DRAFT_18598 [Pseudoneurospora amorphoporcata]|uniref:Uncharacterized protein n=1 Tax=Pseudoneurospora amorphoporcata TaxID=241081 RepID=A0AAN6SDI5_9PEZI|nr:hypothetical protein QBC32DRAFT_18598 [Pseudoneurospora amorphoporcata]
MLASISRRTWLIARPKRDRELALAPRELLRRSSTRRTAIAETTDIVDSQMSKSYSHQGNDNSLEALKIRNTCTFLLLRNYYRPPAAHLRIASPTSNIKAHWAMTEEDNH